MSVNAKSVLYYVSRFASANAAETYYAGSGSTNGYGHQLDSTHVVQMFGHVQGSSQLEQVDQGGSLGPDDRLSMVGNASSIDSSEARC